MTVHALFFYLFAALALLGAVGVVALRQPIQGAVSLLLTLLSVAALFLLRGAEFLAAAQIVIYAGGILAIFLFAIMFVAYREEEKRRRWHPQWPAAVVLGLGLAATLLAFLLRPALGVPAGLGAAQAAAGGNTEALAEVLFRTYLVPFEVISLFLIVAMVGGILMASWGVKR
jgi:NADH-quinone oxidoreductase subunit J